jgi:hypothetical protein
MAQNEVRLQLHALAHNLGVFLQGTDLPEEMANWSLTSLQTRLIKIGASVVRHARAITFQLAEVAVSGDLFNRILAAIQRLRAPPVPGRRRRQQNLRKNGAVGLFQRGVDHNKILTNPAVETRNPAQFLRQVPKQRRKSYRPLDRGAKRRQPARKGILFGECRLSARQKSATPVRGRACSVWA